MVQAEKLMPTKYAADRTDDPGEPLNWLCPRAPTTSLEEKLALLASRAMPARRAGDIGAASGQTLFQLAELCE
ncbi:MULTISPECIES: hypothetical protein [unclassified Bradyrhizobium]